LFLLACGLYESGRIHVIVVDNASSDETSDEALNAGKSLGLELEVLFEKNPGKYFGLLDQ
jgi:glycosyltransferase involved in cell wall biosynthesis